MQESPDAGAAAALDALKRGDAAAAAALFRDAIARGADQADAWFGLSLAQRALGAADAERAALDRTLEREPRHLPALIRTGDLHTAAGDARAASSFYRAALRIGEAIASLGPEWRAELKRIGELCESNSRAFEQHLLGDLTRRGLGAPGSERFGHAVELLLGRRRIFVQQPQVFYFPELPQIQFYERSAFAWATELERETAAIREELLGVLGSGADIVPYMQREPNRPAFDNNGLLDDPAWSAYHLLREGKEVAAHAARCPRTMAALRSVPTCKIAGRTPIALYSLLRPGAHIPPHHGFLNTRLICHLPLIVPPGCALRVGNETRAWREGELVVFDDTIEHEAWNRSSELRAVLLFDIWRPELSAVERTLVAEMLESIDRLGGARREWTQ
jgi:aspartate beta-hydroxylase